MTTILIGSWVIRHLGPEQYGNLSLIIAIHSIILTLSKLGLDNILTRELVLADHKYKEILLGTGLRLRLAFSILSIFVVFGLAYISHFEELYLYLLVLISCIIFQSFEILEIHFVSSVDSKIITLIKMIGLLLFSFSKIALILTGAEYTSFVLLLCLEFFVVYSSIFVYFKRKTGYEILGKYDFAESKRLINEAFPYILSSFMIIAYMRTDQIMISSFLQLSDLGVYSSAVRIVESLFFIPTVVSVALFPALLNAKSNSLSLYVQRTKGVYALLVTIMLIIAVLILFGANLVTDILLGEEFETSANIIRILCINLVLMPFGVISGKWIVSNGFSSLALLRSITGLIVNIIFNFILIPMYGINGAAVATVAGQFASIFVFGFTHKKMRLHMRIALSSLNMSIVRKELKSLLNG